MVPLISWWKEEKTLGSFWIAYSGSIRVHGILSLINSGVDEVKHCFWFPSLYLFIFHSFEKNSSQTIGYVLITF